MLRKILQNKTIGKKGLNYLLICTNAVTAKIRIMFNALTCNYKDLGSNYVLFNAVAFILIEKTLTKEQKDILDKSLETTFVELIKD